jgi:hypothetical protein
LEAGPQEAVLRYRLEAVLIVYSMQASEANPQVVTRTWPLWF